MGWTDEDKINISNDNMFYAPKKEILQESEIFENSSQNDKVSRFYIFSILQGIINDGKLLRLPEKVKVTAPSPYIVFSMADGWIEDDTFGSWTDILNATAGELSKGDAVLTMQRIMRDDAMNYNRDSTQYAAFCNNRGRGEKNRTHDVHLRTVRYIRLTSLIRIFFIMCITWNIRIPQKRNGIIRVKTGKVGV